MSNKVIYERFLWFHSQVKKGRFPNATTLAERFEYRRRPPRGTSNSSGTGSMRRWSTIRRDGAMPTKTRPTSFPPPGSAQELTSLLISFRLASAMPDPGMKGG